MKQITIDTNGTETETPMTRAQVIEAHKRMIDNQQAGADFLASIHAEIGDWDQNAAEAAKEYREEQIRQAEMGLTSEINTNKEHLDIHNTLENCATLLRRHQHGFKGFIRTQSGKIKDDPYTAEENKEASEFMATIRK